MAKYRKKPIVVEATQWFKNGDHPEDPINTAIEGLVVRYYRHPSLSGHARCSDCGHELHDHGWIDIPLSFANKGGHTVCPADWIITHIKGMFYPCKPDIFEQTHEFEPIEIINA